MLESGEEGNSFAGIFGVNVGLAFVDCVIAASSFLQLVRIHSRNSQLGWIRQKVFHLMIGSSNFATSRRESLWWSYFCSFVLMAFPKILFFAAFLLLLSFWIDLCHQANDDDEDEDCSHHELLLERTLNKPSTSDSERPRRCLPCQFFHVRSRQKIVIFVIVMICVLTIVSFVLIWIGLRKHFIDPYLVAQIYVALFAILTFSLGGALAYYGTLLCLRMRRVRSEGASSEIWKVSGLAVVSVLCFTLSASVALLPNTPILYYWQHQKVNGAYAVVSLIFYYFIGSSIPSAFLLWVMRELPPTVIVQEEPGTITFVSDSSELARHPQRWTAAMSSQDQVSRASPI